MMQMLYRMAFAVETEETWRAIWESLAGGSRVRERNAGTGPEF